MQSNKIRLLVVSDLHCHRFDHSPADSFLLAGGPRRPAEHHPMEALFTCIDAESLEVDCIVAPGDFADKICQIGFGHSWQLLEELSWRLGRVPVIPALGNHDVDSRHSRGADVFKIPRNLSPRFPFDESQLYNQYFAQGFCIVPLSASVDVISINSVIDHHDEETAKRGAFGPDRLAALQSALDAITEPRSFRVALMHHHPMLHSSPVLSDEDVLPSGDQLLDALAKYGSALVIHGHKHHPRLNYADTSHGRLPVLAAGSFSALLKELSSRTRNVFHLVEITRDSAQILGSVRTWEWRQGEGWVRASLQLSDFPHLAGFGADFSVEQMKSAITSLAGQAQDKWLFSWQDLKGSGAQIDHLTPGEFQQLSRKLEELNLRLEPRGVGFELSRLYITHEEPPNE